MNEHNDQELSDTDGDKEAESPKGIQRREALAALAKLGAYTAPSVILLLSPQVSYSAGSAIPPGNNECQMGGSGSMHMNAGANHDGTMGFGGNGNDRNFFGDDNADC